MSLNKLKTFLQQFFEQHGMINSVYYMNDFDFSAQRNIVYPCVNIEYVNTSMSKKTFDHSFKIIIADLCQPDNNEHQDNIHSDSLQVAEDFFTYLQNFDGTTEFNFDLKRTSTLNPFIDDKGDRCAGIVFTLSLAINRPMNWCNTPTK